MADAGVSDTDVDAYFAQHDVQKIMSDLLFELGSQRPRDVRRFIAGYVERHFCLLEVREEQCDGSRPFHEVEVRHAASSLASREDALACGLLQEARALRRKYRDFCPQRSSAGREPKGTPRQRASQQHSVISCPEFRLDYERLLLILSTPDVWAFCERRLKMLRGLFDVHKALNGAAEDEEAASAPLPLQRADNCRQLARALPAAKLMDLIHEKAAAGDGKEVVQGKTLRELLDELGRPPMPEDVTVDADTLVSKVGELRAVFSKRGPLLAEAAKASLKVMESIDAATRGTSTWAEYRLPLLPESGSWNDLGSWVADFGVAGDRLRWVVQLPQAAYDELKDRRSVLNFGELLDNLFGPLAAAAASGPAEAEEVKSLAELACLLNVVSAFELCSLSGHSPETISSEADVAPRDWANFGSPPFPYQLYHVWARLKLLNQARGPQGGGAAALQLRVAANTLEPMACGYLLGASGFSRCGALAKHAPLQYLAALDGVFACVSLASRRSLGGSGAEGASALSELFKAGVFTTLCTEDPLVSQECADALGAEYSLARSLLGLSQADVQELAKHSMALAHGAGEPAALCPEAMSIRERFRDGRRKAEDSFIRSLVA